MPVDSVHMHAYLRLMQDDFSQCLVLNTRMAARAITRRADRKLRPFGVTAAQFNVLGSLLAHPGRSITELADAIAMDRTTLSRNLALLERKGMVTSAPAERGNGRAQALTEHGTQTVEAILPEWRRSQAELRETLADPDFPTIVAALRQLARL